MLVMCIHLPTKTISAVPGALLPDKTFSGKLLGTQGGNSDFIVQPEELAGFLQTLYAAVSAGRSDCLWPTDSLHDVSSICMVTHEEANLPREATREKRKSMPTFGERCCLD
jgi:hypothetical protein